MILNIIAPGSGAIGAGALAPSAMTGAGLGGGFFDKGGMIAKGPGSLPKIPQARNGMYTGDTPGARPIIAHEREWIIPDRYLGQTFATMATNFFKGSGMNAPMMAPAMAGGGPTVVINLHGINSFDRPGLDYLVQTGIIPALNRINWNRGYR